MISVCIPTFNGEKYIKDQIESILCQLNLDDEIIISDDKSDDNTIEIIESFKDKRIKIFINQNRNTNKYYSFMFVTCNLENALSKAKGDFIYLADQDDVWFENKVSVTQKKLECYDLVLSDCQIIDENNKVLHESYFSINKSKIGVFTNIVNNSYLGCCMAFRKEVLKFSLPMSKYNVPHDIWFGLLAEIYMTVYYEPSKLIKYRRHGDNLSSSADVSSKSIYYKISYRCLLIMALIKIYFFNNKLKEELYS